ncbi:glycosyltransferase family 4 protein [Bradyrhizobium tropiciagri]|uniref:glycosyltransferase family 4 protein n=1 Tax=Bradyrhizobium tropiciagri TaxID=312253 RepID=UPI00067B6B62|nr:glycosyltransferase family 1 protein [Bradyrhizobium tropiciagri]
MSITIDGIIFSLQRQGGISVYFRELIAHLEKVCVPATLTIDAQTIQDTPPSSGTLQVVQQTSRWLERYRSARDPAESTVLHSSYYRLPARGRQASVVTVYDFTYERFIKGPALWVHRHQKHAAIRAAQAIICISEATRDDLLEFVGVRSDQTIHVIPLGGGETYRPLDDVTSSSRDLLFVGERRGYKNFRLLLEALTFLTEHRVQCVGGGPLRTEEFEGISTDVRNRVSHLGFVTDEQLNGHYNRVAGLVYPSAYEGFGIPVLEAMRAGCPVVAVECKAVREVGGSALVVASDASPAALAQAIKRLDDAICRSKMISTGLKRATGFSWQATHERTLQVYRELGGLPVE